MLLSQLTTKYLNILVYMLSLHTRSEFEKRFSYATDRLLTSVTTTPLWRQFSFTRTPVQAMLLSCRNVCRIFKIWHKIGLIWSWSLGLRSTVWEVLREEVNVLLRGLVGMIRMVWVRNEEVRKAAEMKRELTSRVDHWVLPWLGRMDKMDEQRTARRILIADASGRRVRGREKLVGFIVRR